jgi:thioredoxin reductase (NADPH)
VNSTDVIVVGAGPIGLELAVALKTAGMDYVHFEAGQIGQTVSWYPRQVRFFSSPERIAIAGVPLVTPDQMKATREEYLAYLRGVVEQFDLPIRTYERVTSISKKTDGFHVVSERRGQETEWRSRRVVLAVGDMARSRRLGIPGEDRPHVSHYFEDPHPYFHQKLVIVGGRNSAVEAAIRCHRAGAHVTLSYRQEQFRAQSIKYWLMPEIESFVRQGHIVFHPRTEPTTIGEDTITLKRLDGGAPLTLTADFVLLLVGYEADLSLFQMAGVTLEGENKGPVHDPETMETDVPGLYVAGTAAAGTQHQFRLFIENAHVHVDRIVAALTGTPVRERKTRGFTLPES